ncbi:hypothetical protein EAG_14948 [Camponotus floridanus]|uniref:Uncharacterized protein n=1 Tax=Camponotus floridanus TaxID=104421 RepID=E2ATK3_CAMFO|nr:hypothetical protein EAG_14948 [Camponotus floridanus]
MDATLWWKGLRIPVVWGILSGHGLSLAARAGGPEIRAPIALPHFLSCRAEACLVLPREEGFGALGRMVHHR